MKRNFTLIELLIVIAIIAILTALLLPALARAREKAHKISCMSRIKNLSFFQNTYADLYDDFFPPNPGSGMAEFYAPAGSELLRMLNIFNQRNAYFLCPSAPYLKRALFNNTGMSWVKTGGTSYQMPAGYYRANPNRTDNNYLHGWQRIYYMRYPSNPSGGVVIVNRKYKSGIPPTEQPTAVDANQPNIGIWRPYGGSTNHMISLNGYGGLESNHKDGSNIIFLDGHAVWRNNGEMQYRIGLANLVYRVFW